MKSTEFASAIRATQLRLEILEAFAALADLDTREAKTLASELAQRAGVTASSRRGEDANAPSRFQQLVEWFVSRDNRPATKPEIAASLGLSGGVLHALIYSQAPEGALVTDQNPAGGRHRVISLNPDLFERSRHRSE